MQSNDNSGKSAITENNYFSDVDFEHKKLLIKELKQKGDVSKIARELECTNQVYCTAMWVGNKLHRNYTDKEMHFIQRMYERVRERQKLMHSVGLECNVPDLDDKAMKNLEYK